MNYITYTDSNIYELTSDQDVWVKTVYDGLVFFQETGEEIFHSAMSYKFNRDESVQLWSACQAGETAFDVVKHNTVTYYLHAANGRILWLDYVDSMTVVKTSSNNIIDALHNCELLPVD